MERSGGKDLEVLVLDSVCRRELFPASHLEDGNC